MVVPMNYNSSGGDDFDCSFNPVGDCTINVTAYAFMWNDRKNFLTSTANWNPPLTRPYAAPLYLRARDKAAHNPCRYPFSAQQTQQQQLLGYM